MLWSVYGECENVSMMTGHTGAVMEAHFSTDGSNVYTCATDKTLSIWDVPTSQRLRKLKGHTGFVNSVCGTRRGNPTLVSGSDDCTYIFIILFDRLLLLLIFYLFYLLGTIKIWDPRKKHVLHTLDNKYQVTAVCFNDTGEYVISGGIDNEVKVWDMRQNDILYTLSGHSDTVTGVSLSPDGAYILSNSMDNTLRVWDIRPYAPVERCVQTFVGHQHNFEKNLLRSCWSPDGTRVSAGSSDRYVYIWDFSTGRILYKLPGHNGSVNDVDFHPTEPIILSGSSDKNLYLGEIDA